MAFKRIFTCKIWLRYSRERALNNLAHINIWKNRSKTCIFGVKNSLDRLSICLKVPREGEPSERRLGPRAEGLAGPALPHPLALQGPSQAPHPKFFFFFSLHDRQMHLRYRTIQLRQLILSPQNIGSLSLPLNRNTQNEY